MLETLPDVNEAIIQHIADAWVIGALPRTPVRRENQVADEPDDAYIHVSIEILRAPQESLGQPGNRRFQRRGVVRIVIRTPINTGTEQSTTLQQAVVDMFEGEELDGISFYEVIPNTVGRDGRWHLTMVEALFFYIQVK